MALYGDAPFAFQVHIVQHLILKLSVCDRVGGLQQTVGQGAFAVVNVGDDAKIPYVLHKVLV